MRRIVDLDHACALVKQTADIVAVVEAYGIETERSGPNRAKAICPFHEDTDPSLSIHTEKQLFHCFGCHEGGDVIHFVRLSESLSVHDAVLLLAEAWDLDLSSLMADPTPEDIRRRRLTETNERVRDTLIPHRDRDEMFEWVRKRSLDSSVLEQYAVSYCSKFSIVKDIKGLGAAGLESRRLFTDSIVFPLNDEYGRPMAFRARPLSGRLKAIGPAEDHPLPIPPVYGFGEARKAIRTSGELILVEGEVDLWQMVAHGKQNCCAALGSHLSEETLQWLSDRAVRRLVVLPDGDKAGRDMARRIAQIKNRRGVQIRIALIDEGDPDELLQQDPEIVFRAIKEAVLPSHFVIDEIISGEDIKSPTGRLDALDLCSDFIVSQSMAERQVVGDYLAERLGLEPQVVEDYYQDRVSAEQKTLADTRAEKEILACSLQNEEQVGALILSGLEASAFFLPKHQRIFRVIEQLYISREPVTASTVRTEVKRRVQTDVEYLDDILKINADPQSLTALVRSVRDFALRRGIQDSTQKLGTNLFDLSTNPREMALDSVASLTRMAIGHDIRVRSASVLSEEFIHTLHERVQNPNLIIGLDLGKEWRSLNHAIHGLQAPRYVIAAAPSGVGKTTLAACWIRRIAVDLGQPSLLLTFETGAQAYTSRIVAGMARIEQQKIATGYLGDEEVEEVHEATARLAASPLEITGAGRTYEDALAIIRHDILKRQTQFVVLDYLQLMRMRQKERGMARHEELGRISSSLMELAYEYDVRVLGLAQINRDGAKRARSTMEDVGQAFQIAQDADIFIVIDEKTEVEQKHDGLEKGNRIAVLEKNRSDGPSPVVWNMMADTHLQTMKEV